MAAVSEPVVERADLSIDVEHGRLAASVAAPPDALLAAEPTVLVCVPGMTYRRSYYDLRFDGRPGYSFA